ncbi:hypothetical protein V1527DRAFT_474894 [Lipomyces starkeyi]
MLQVQYLFVALVDAAEKNLHHTESRLDTNSVALNQSDCDCYDLPLSRNSSACVYTVHIYRHISNSSYESRLSGIMSDGAAIKS